MRRLALVFALPFLLSAQSIGSLESDLKYGRDYLEAGNPAGAASYFRTAVTLHPDHAEANLLLAYALAKSGRVEEGMRYLDHALSVDPSLDARPEVAEIRRRPARAAAVASAPPAWMVAPMPAAPAGTSAPQTAARAGDENSVGSVAYLLRYARYHRDNKDPSAAAKYAREALALDPGSAEAKAILAQTGSAARNAKAAPKTCQEKFSTCWSGATRYTPGSGYSADNARRQMCMVERNICQGAQR